MCVCVRVCVHPGAVIAHSAASSQAGVEIGNAVRAADRSVLVDPAATVDVATARQVPVSHRQSRTADTGNVTLRTRATHRVHLIDQSSTKLSFEAFLSFLHCTGLFPHFLIFLYTFIYLS